MGRALEIDGNLERKLEKLDKINRVLMDQVERSMDYQGNEFSIFQTAIVLEDRVKERTSALEEALQDLESSNRELARAKTVAETAENQLVEAIESIEAGFTLFDKDGRLVLFNSTFRNLLPGVTSLIEVGMSRQEIAQEAVNRNILKESEVIAWLSGDLQAAYSKYTYEPIVVSLKDGRWMQINERVTKDGGAVVVYTDITDIKNQEDMRREQELAAKNILQKSTLDSLAQGVAAFDEGFKLETWNDRLLTLLGEPFPVLEQDLTYVEFLNRIGGQVDGEIDGTDYGSVLSEPLTEITRPNGCILEIRRSAMPAGGFVNVFTDITRRRKDALSLEEAKENLEKRVAERTVELVSLNEILRQEITERKEVERALQLAKNEAETANQSKDKFLAAASHDLLQPLNAARLMIATLQERNMRDTNRHLVGQIHVALAGAEELLGDLLDISKLDAQAVTVKLSEFPVSQIFSSLKTEFAPIAEQEGLELTVIPTSLCVRSDARLLTRVIRNFMSNAFRYTPQGRVLVGCRRKGKFVSIEVCDTGPGIPKDKLNEIFEEFHQLENQSEKRGKGVGLGLAIVDRIARMLNSDIKVWSKEGKGSAFSITAPITETVIASGPETMDQSLLKGTLAGSTILIVDNELSIVDSMELLLKEWDCLCIPATSGEKALQAIENKGVALPDIILADYQLDDGETGLDVIAAIRKKYKTDIPAVMITAEYNEDRLRVFEALGLPALNKPLKPGKLRALMTHILAQR
ncbi:MAG: PAS-domain containing protein [Rhodospirillales bacterium]|nr:PAS-domain containing protein [Rhodospirillales bacterium]